VQQVRESCRLEAAHPEVGPRRGGVS
jgi:hypothetical protein